jgi:hypothetical protein
MHQQRVLSQQDQKKNVVVDGAWVSLSLFLVDLFYYSQSIFAIKQVIFFKFSVINTIQGSFGF